MFDHLCPRPVDAVAHAAERDFLEIRGERAIRDLVRALRVLGYESVRQDGFHIRLTTTLDGTHPVTVPNHRPLKTGNLLGGILKPVAAQYKPSIEPLLAKLELSTYSNHRKC